MVEEIKINGESYYQIRYGNSVGDIFQDWKEIPRYKQKLSMQIARSSNN